MQAVPSQAERKMNAVSIKRFMRIKVLIHLQRVKKPAQRCRLPAIARKKWPFSAVLANC
jgi:hypothetical protein